MSQLLEYIYGPVFCKMKKQIRSTEFLDKETIRRNCSAKLYNLVKYALTNIEYYKTNSFYAKRIDSPSFEKLFFSYPILDKKKISNNIKMLQARPKIRGVKKNTGGSTGTPFVFFLERFITREKEKAFIFDQWGRVGYKVGDKIFNLRGSLPPKGHFIKHEKLFNIYNASSLSLSALTVRKYINHITQIKPDFLHGYPSTIYLLACLVEDAGLRIDYGLKGIFCGSEKLFPYQRQKIEQTFQAKVFAWYGHSEYQILAGECEYSKKLHIYPQYGYTELIPTGKKHIDGKEIFEIIATGFNNYYMPILRYRTQDYATLSDNQECNCGRNYILLDEVIGREQEFIVDKDETILSITPLIYGQHFPEFEAIEAFQIQQSKIGIITILIQPKDNSVENQAINFISGVKQLVGERFDVKFKLVNNIVKSEIGKSKTVIQELNISKYISTS